MEVDLNNVQSTRTREILGIVASEIDAVSEGNIKLMIVIFLKVLVLSAQHAAALSMLLTALSMLLRHIDSIFSSSFGWRSSMPHIHEQVILLRIDSVKVGRRGVAYMS